MISAHAASLGLWMPWLHAYLSYHLPPLSPPPGFVAPWQLSDLFCHIEIRRRKLVKRALVIEFLARISVANLW